MATPVPEFCAGNKANRRLASVSIVGLVCVCICIVATASHTQWLMQRSKIGLTPEQGQATLRNIKSELDLYDSNKLTRLDAVDDFFGHNERKLEFEDLRLKDTEKATADEHDHQVAALVELYTSVDGSRLATVDSVLQFSKTIRAPNGITPDVANAESFVTNPEDKFNEQLLRVKGTLDTMQFLAQNFPNPESRRLEEKCRELETDIARHKVQFNYDTEFKAKQCGITRDSWAALMQQQVDMVSEADWRAYRDKKKILPGHFMALDDACKEKAFVGIHDCPYRPWDTIEGGFGRACSKWFDNSGEKQGTRKKPGAEGFHIYIRLFHMLSMAEASFTDHCKLKQFLEYVE